MKRFLLMGILVASTSSVWAEVEALRDKANNADKEYKACIKKVTTSRVCDEVCEKWATNEKHVENAFFIAIAQNMKKCRNSDSRAEDACIYSNMEYEYGLKVNRSNPESSWKSNKEAMSKFLRKQYAGTNSHAMAVCKDKEEASSAASRNLSNAIATQRMEVQRAKDETNRRWVEQQIQQQEEAERQRVQDLENYSNAQILMGQQMGNNNQTLFGLEGVVKNEGAQILKNAIFGN